MVNADRARQTLENIIIALAYLYFADAHYAVLRTSPQWYLVAPMMVQETLLAVMFLCRRPSLGTSPRVDDWIVGIAGSTLALLVRPLGAGNAVGAGMQMVGLSIAIAALLSLRRSMGIVAANRGIATKGAYKIVRHPMYLGHGICLLGYLVAYTSWYNAAVILAALWALGCRMVAEERWLMGWYGYRNYAAETKWRLVPGIF